MPDRRFVKLRLVLLTVVGLGLIYKVAAYRGLIPSIADLQALADLQPVTCPADDKIHTAPKAFVNSDKPIAQLLPANFDRTKTSILIEKSQHRLTVYYDQKPIKSYPVVFGGSPEGDKQREGDLKTPEGILRIQDKYPHPTWSKFLWLDYPNVQSQCKHRRAKQQREIPWNSSIGGEVGIHGVPGMGDWMIDAKDNWTLGCPSLKNKDVDELYEVVQVGTIVEIVA